MHKDESLVSKIDAVLSRKGLRRIELMNPLRWFGHYSLSAAPYRGQVFLRSKDDLWRCVEQLEAENFLVDAVNDETAHVYIKSSSPTTQPR